MFTTIAPPDGNGTRIGQVGIQTEVRLLLHSVKDGDENVVLSAPAYAPNGSVIGALTPSEARLFAYAILDAADAIDWSGSPDAEYRRVMTAPGARGRFREGMAIARGIYRPAG